MKNYGAESIRNICLLSHGGVGKTSLLEAACYTAKATNKLGNVDNKTSIFDVRPDEKERGMTISTKVGTLEWNNTKINMIDTPGFLDFLGDAKAALRAVESAAILVDAAAGPEVGTELVSRLVDESKAPRLFFMNGMDHENVDFNKTLQKLRDTFGTSTAPLHLPIGSGSAFKGVVNLIEKVAYEYQPGGKGIGKKTDVPADMAEAVEAARNGLMESIAESDEDLMNKYFEEGELTTEDLRKGLADGVAKGLIYPIFCGSATQNIGVDLFLNAVVNICPSPLARANAVVIADDQEKEMTCAASEPTAAFVFKTISEEHVGELSIVRVFSGKLAAGTEVANTTRGGVERLGGLYFLRGHERIDTNEINAGDIGGILKLKDTHTNDTLAEKNLNIQFPKTDFGTPLVSTAISAKSKGDEDKVSAGIAKLHEEDPTFTYGFHPDIHQSILSAMGDIHLDVILEGLKRRFKVEVERTEPKISYRETITKPAKYVEYTHKKQTGGAGQYARVFIDLEPLPRGEGYQFEDKIVGGVIDQSLRPSVDKGIRSKMDEGILAGYPIVDVKVSLVDGKTHPVDSKDIAFQIAGREVFKKAFEMASPILLEPIAELTVSVPDDYTGDVMGDLSSRRGKIGGMEPAGKYQTIRAKVPESTVRNYSQSLRAMTQGRGFFQKEFSHYEAVPAEVTKKIIEATQAAEAHE
ncbi:MAG: elongation factor G [Chitinivibrionales bacterium]|nr:elongation factor G [Chitinivibrionales bacterium]MBD3357150.1 elongation factor G [Chitinivibrionales bacterium]